MVVDESKLRWVYVCFECEADGIYSPEKADITCSCGKQMRFSHVSYDIEHKQVIKELRKQFYLNRIRDYDIEDLCMIMVKHYWGEAAQDALAKIVKERRAD